MRLDRLLLALVTWILIGSSLQAALTISIEDVAIPEGGTGYVDARLTNVDAGTTLGFFFVTFTDAGAPIEFLTPGSSLVDSNDTYGHADYVFAGEANGFLISFNAANSVGPIGTGSPDEFSAGDNVNQDAVADGFVALDEGDLLVRIPVSAGGSVAGESFDIGIIVEVEDPDDPSGPPIEVSTLFSALDEGGLQGQLLFEVDPGTVTILPRVTPAVVPEPTSVVAWLALLAGVMGMGIRRQLSRQALGEETN